MPGDTWGSRKIWYEDPRRSTIMTSSRGLVIAHQHGHEAKPWGPKKKGQCSNYRDLSIFVVEWPVLSWVCTNTNVTLLCWVVAIKYIFLVGILLLGGHMGPNLRLQSVSFTSQALAKRIMDWFPAGRMSFNHKTLFCGSIRWSDSNFFFIFNSTGVAMTKVPLGATNKEI